MEIYYYAIIIVIGILIVFHRFFKKSGKFGVKFENILDLSIILIPLSFIGARIYYIVFNLNYYMADFTRIFDFRSGGLAIYGGIIAGGITVYLYCKKHNSKMLNITDYVAPELALAQAIGRWGNFVNIEAYGKITSLPWRMGIFENGIYKEVHPTFLYESLADFIIFLILTKLSKKRKFSGQITYMYLICYSITRFFIESLRVDSLMLNNIKISKLFSAVLFVVFCLIFYFNVNRYKKMQTNIGIGRTKVLKN